MRNLVFLAAVLAAVPAAPMFAAKGDIAAGQRKAAVCHACHGAAGISGMAGVPSIAGLQDQFLQWQLVFFRSGRRKSDLMSPMAAPLTDADIRDLGAYFASLPPPGPSGGTNQALPGAAIAQQNHCANCHMDDFTGNRGAPRLAHQREDYLVKALSDYRSGARPSTGVAAMNEAAEGLSDADIKALAHYLATLP